MQRAYRLALLCGTLPLVAGLSIFLLWLLTRWEWLPVAGLITIGVGLAIFAVGAIALVRYCRLAFRSPEMPRRRVWLCALGCGALLLSNLPVAAGIALAAISIETCYTVTISNSSQEPLREVRVSGGGCEVSFGTIRPGDSAKHSFQIGQDGQLELCFELGAGSRREIIDGYVTNGQGARTKVTVGPDGRVNVTNEQK